MALRSTYGWRWSLVLGAGFAWLSVGCSPQTLSMFLMPFVDTNKEPEHKLFAADREINLVITSNFATRQLQPEFVPADHELADAVAVGLRKRCQAAKHTLKIVPQADVRSYELKKRSLEGDVSPLDVGKHFKADYVLDLSIDQFSLYQKDAYPKMYRGTTRIAISLYDVKSKVEEGPTFMKTFLSDYTGSRIPREVGNSKPADFRQMFMASLGRDISRVFIAYSPDELKEWDASRPAP